jgi:hypothetical protein
VLKREAPLQISEEKIVERKFGINFPIFLPLRLFFRRKTNRIINLFRHPLQPHLFTFVKLSEVGVVFLHFFGTNFFRGTIFFWRKFGAEMSQQLFATDAKV